MTWMGCQWVPNQTVPSFRPRLRKAFQLSTTSSRIITARGEGELNSNWSLMSLTLISWNDFRTVSGSNETISERRQALLLKRALYTSPDQHIATSSNESLSQRHKGVHIHEPTPPLRNGQSKEVGDARCVITTHQKPLHIYSIIPFKKRTSSSVSKVKEKLEVRPGGRKVRHASTSRPITANAGENQPFDPFNLLGIERRTDGGQELSYGYLLVPSKTGGGKNGVSRSIDFVLTLKCNA